MDRMMDYRTLGRTGLMVSPPGLGVMTYGWGIHGGVTVRRG